MTDDIQTAFNNIGVDWVPRPVQREAVDWLHGEQPRLSLLEMPTGIGKSGLALAYGSLASLRTVVLTATISLQHQYEKDFDVVVMKGRGNYKCLENGMTAAEGECTVRKLGLDERCGSPYYAMRARAREADRVVANYAVWLSELFYSRPPFRPKLLVCDEAHRLLDLLTSFEMIRLDARLARKLGMRIGGWDTVSDAMAWCDSNIGDVEQDRFEAVKARSKKARDWTALHRQMEGVQAYSTARDIVLKTGETVEVSPLWPHRSAKRLLESCEAMLCMSATLYGGHELSELLGYNDIEDVVPQFYTVASPFSAHRWPVYYRPAGAPSKRRPGDWGKIAAVVHDYIHAGYKTKGVIHVAARNQVDQVLSEARRCLDCDTRLVAPTGDESRRETIDRYKRGPRGTWLCHPSVGEGEDFKDDEARIQLVAKVPYPDLGDKLTRLRQEDGPLGKRMYAAITAGKLAQMAGRGMRHDRDYCETVILDGNFGRLWKWHKELFPRWFVDVLRFGE